MSTFDFHRLRSSFRRELKRDVRRSSVGANVDEQSNAEPRRSRFSQVPLLLTLVFAIASGPLFFGAIGCALSSKAKLPVVLKEAPSVAELKEVVNSNGSKIQSIYASSATVATSGLPGWANCRLAFQKPGNFRLVGSAVASGRVLDCGCNAERFWFWSSFQKSDELYYCNLDQYQGSALSRLIPLDPTWFPAALGIVEINDDDVVDGPIEQADGSLLVTVKKKRPDGDYRQRIYFEPKTAAILRQDIQNPNGDAVVSVRCKESQYIESVGVVLPKKLEIVCPSSNETFLVDLGTPTVNDTSKISANDFEQPTDIKATAIDLGKTFNVAASSTPPSTQPATPPTTQAAAPENAPATSPTTAEAPNVVIPPPIQGTGLPVDAYQKGTPIDAPADATSSTGLTPQTNGAFAASVSPNSVYSNNSLNQNQVNSQLPANSSSVAGNSPFAADGAPFSLDSTDDVSFPSDLSAPNSTPLTPPVVVEPSPNLLSSTYVEGSSDSSSESVSTSAPFSSTPSDWQSVPDFADAAASGSLLIDETRGLDSQNPEPYVVEAPTAAPTLPSAPK